jgi:type I restriction enzyme S subunit
LDAEANINQAVALIRLVEISDGPLVRYLLQYLNSSTAIEFMLGSRVITAQPNMSLTDSREFPIPLPPLAEQHRIVAKVDELMALCDGLEEESAAALEAHQRLAECLLATLVDSSDASNLASNWSRFEVHFDTLFSTEESIDALKRTVLELAVRGKLVPQDPQDEPASDLLKRIAKEKARLFKVGEGRKEKPLLPVDEEANFDIPPTWEWTRLGIVTSYIQRGKSPKYATENGSLVVSQKCIQWRGLDLSVSKQITIDSLVDYESIRFLRDGDLLWNSTGTGTIGRVIRLVDPPEKLVCDSHVTVVR